MAGITATQFAYRAEALAYIALARRPDLVVEQEVIYQDTGLDMLASLGRDGEPSDRKFAVEVKARLSDDLRVKQRPGRPGATFLFVEREIQQLLKLDIPCCLFVYLIDTDQGFYAW